MSETRKIAAILVEYSRLAGLLLFLSPAARGGAAPRCGYASGKGGIGGRPEAALAKPDTFLRTRSIWSRLHGGRRNPAKKPEREESDGEQALPFERVVSGRVGP